MCMINLMCIWTRGPGVVSNHNNDVIMSAMASQITRLIIVYSTVYSGTDQRKHKSSASLAFVRGIHRSPVNSPHKWPVTWKMFPFDDVIMCANGFWNLGVLKSLTLYKRSHLSKYVEDICVAFYGVHRIMCIENGILDSKIRTNIWSGPLVITNKRISILNCMVILLRRC